MSDFMNKNGHICDVGCEGLREEVGYRKPKSLNSKQDYCENKMLPPKILCYFKRRNLYNREIVPQLVLHKFATKTRKEICRRFCTLVVYYQSSITIPPLPFFYANKNAE